MRKADLRIDLKTRSGTNLSGTNARRWHPTVRWCVRPEGGTCVERHSFETGADTTVRATVRPPDLRCCLPEHEFRW
jgi:hypothetical protein